MSVSDLTNTTWIFNETPTGSPLGASASSVIDVDFYVNFTSNNSNYNDLWIAGQNSYLNNMMYDDDDAYNNSRWVSEEYRTITITGGADVTNANLISWLETNAEQQIYDVAVFFNNNRITVMNSDGTKTLTTAGKYVTDNITIEYTKPTPELQTKTVTPTTSSQSVTPDTGYDGLSSVTVSAMPSGSITLPDITITENSFNYITDSVSNSGLVSTTFDLDANYNNGVSLTSGYISNYTGNCSLTGYYTHTYQLPVKAAQTYTPTTTDQTIANGQYLTGVQTIKGDANLIAANIADGVSIFGITGTHSGGITPTGTISITQNGTVDVTNYATADVNVPTGGITPVPLKDVNFIDYDGTVLYSYTASDFANLTELPANPTHDGLVSNGWMYTLAQAKAQAASDGKLYVGHFYNTTDGRTRIKIRLAEGRLSPYLGLYINGTATVDWGDGSVTSTVTGSTLNSIVSTQHTYPSAGEYTIYIAVNSGRIRLGGNANYGQLLWANETASATRTKNAVYMIGITELNIGDNCQIGSTLLYSAIYAELTYPSYTVIGTSLYGFGLGQHLPPILCLPYGITALGNYAVDNNYVRAVQIPNTVTSIGNSVFAKCYAIASLIIPSSVASIGTSCFSDCYGLAELHFKPTTPPTVANSNAFSNLPTDCKIYVPSGYLSAYTSATNYPSSATYTYVEE